MKDAYYFPHFCNARHDRKIQRVMHELGIEGYGIFFMLLEVLRDQTDFMFPMSDIDLLSKEFGTSEQKVRTVICNYNLFEVDEDQKFFSPKLIVFLQPYINMRERRKDSGRIGGIKSGEARRNNKLAIEAPLEAPLEANEAKESKVKESKVKESKVKEIYLENVSLTREEYKKLDDKYGTQQTQIMIDQLSNYKFSSGKKYKSDYAAILTWVIDWYNKKYPPTIGNRDSIPENHVLTQQERDSIINMTKAFHDRQKLNGAKHE